MKGKYPSFFYKKSAQANLFETKTNQYKQLTNGCKLKLKSSLFLEYQAPSHNGRQQDRSRYPIVLSGIGCRPESESFVFTLLVYTLV